MSRLCMHAFLVGALVLAPSSRPAWGQTIDASQEATRLFNEAVVLLQDGRYLEALGLLERARNLREVPAVLYNIALAERSLGRSVQAVATLERYLEIAGSRLDPARRAEVERLASLTRRSIANVTVRVGVPNATVTLDAEPFAPEMWGRPVAMNPGRHVLRLIGEGVRPLEVVRELGSGETTEILLSPEQVNVITRLRISSNVDDAEIFVNQLLVGAGRYDARVRPGRFDVDVRARGYLPYSTLVSLAPGQTATLQARLTRDLPVTSRWWFWSAVGVVVTGAAIGIGAAASTIVILEPRAPVTTDIHVDGVTAR